MEKPVKNAELIDDELARHLRRVQLLFNLFVLLLEHLVLFFVELCQNNSLYDLGRLVRLRCFAGVLEGRLREVLQLERDLLHLVVVQLILIEDEGHEVHEHELEGAEARPDLGHEGVLDLVHVHHEEALVRLELRPLQELHVQNKLGLNLVEQHQRW